MLVERIGNATLYLGDAIEILPELQMPLGGRLIVTDPPYGTGGWRRSESGKGSNPSGKLVKENWDSGDTAWVRGLFPSPVISFWPPARMPQLLSELLGAGYEKFRMLYMHKLDPKPQVQNRIAWSVEPIVCASSDGFQLYYGTDFLSCSTPRMGRDAEAVGHPYQKPLTVMEWLIGKTVEGQVVDPFMGSGTTGVAAGKLGREFIGIEEKREYFEMACERIANAQRQERLFA